MLPMSAPRLLWTPDQRFRENANLSRYAEWLSSRYGLTFDDYHALWAWTVEQPARFWESLWSYFRIQSHTPYTEVMSPEPMPHTQWFTGATLNYAEHVFRQSTSSRPALRFASERQELQAVSWKELTEQTAALQAFLRHRGLGPGDRVAAYLPHIPQATVALLATLSLGAVWSSCSPDFGAGSVIDRFRQIEPSVFIAVDGYIYGGKAYDRMAVLKEIRKALPTVHTVILVPYLQEELDLQGLEGALRWKEVMDTGHGALTFVPLPFSHPIWILYSSGTTGIPKAITHSHGGMLLEHLKYLSFHNDVQPGETFFWFSTTGWMMWNFVQASLLAGATALLYDGHPAYPDLGALWRLAARAPIHHFGTSAPFLMACLKAGLRPADTLDLSALRSIGSTGAPLPPEGFDYVYQAVARHVWLCSMSGGTDVCTAWVGGCPWRPVYEGEIQCRALGCALEAFDPQGRPLEDEVGEMVITRPMPCMPVYFWNDPGNVRYLSSYFERFPGVWRHGDWVRLTPRDGLVILGRSDTTLNRQGVRIGTAEIYRVVEAIEGIRDSLIVNVETPGGGSFMPLFVVPEQPGGLTAALDQHIRQELRRVCSPRHVPDLIIEAPEVPYTISGKKMEAPVKQLLLGRNPDQSLSRGAMRNPAALDFYMDYARRWQKPA